MRRLRVKEFGPIISGYTRNEGWIDIKKITLFCGPQGSGKSTLAKLVSTFSWIEKALQRGDFVENDLTYDTLKEDRFEYLGIGNYFHKETEIEAEGDVYSFKVKNKKVSIKKNEEADYKRPKIMYVPAERNFLSTVDEKAADYIKGLPKTLYTLLEEYKKAKPALKRIELPIDGAVFFFDETQGKSFLCNKEGTYTIAVNESASGYQSLLPLILVSRYLSEPKRYDVASSVQPLSFKVANKIKNEAKQIGVPQHITLEFPFDMETNELKAVLEASGIAYSFNEPINKTDALMSQNVKHIKQFLARFYNQCFLNIVEEPEQNLYPASQREILFDLFSCVNKNRNNRLLITTHSPYIIYYLTLAIKAAQLIESDVPSKRFRSIIGTDSIIHGSDTVVYELSERGEVKRLASYKNMPSDENILNKEIIRGNSDFDKLLKMSHRAVPSEC